MEALIAIPAMDTMPTLTCNSLIALRQPYPCRVSFVIRAMVDIARNMLAAEAIKSGVDRVLWIDSDQVFEPDMLEKLSADIDDGWDVVSGLYFTRRLPAEPVIYRRVDPAERVAERYTDYPRGAVFPVAGCGMGACMMRTEVLAEIGEQPFACFPGVSEDLSFCARAAKAGARMACDSRIKVGHYGAMVYGEQFYRHPDAGG